MQEEGPKPHVCRRLFDDENDPADVGARENLLNQIREEISRSLDDACKKYNFDFRTEEPLEGDWAWEKIGNEASPNKPLAEPPSNPEDPPAEPQGSSPASSQESPEPEDL